MRRIGSAFLLTPSACWRAVVAWAALGWNAACQARSGTTATSATDDRVIWAGLFGMVLVPILLWVARKLLVSHVESRMMTASSEQAAQVGAEYKPPEQRAILQPQLAFHDADQVSTATMAPRRKREDEAKSLFNKVFFADLGFAAGYAMLPLLFGLFVQGEVGILGVVIGIALATLAFARYVLHRRQFRAFDLSRSRRRQAVYRRLATVRRVVFGLMTMATGAGFSNLEEAPRLFGGLTSPRLRIYTLWVLGLVVLFNATDASSGYSAVARAESLGLVAAWLAHTAGFWAQAGRMRALTGIRLLVLRVFNLDATSSFTFSGLTRFWRHFGNHYTVVDASLVRQSYSNSTYGTMAVVVLLWVALALLVVPVVKAIEGRTGHSLSTGATCLIVAVVAALGAWAYLAIGRRRLDGRFIRSREQLLRRLERLDRHPRHLDLSFRHERAPCHDNTWFIAVEEFCRRSDVVLMDLRGYSSQRKGCQREVDFLFDVMPVERILFLLDATTDQDELQVMLLARWQQLARASPNLRNRAPQIHLFFCHDNDERDMQAILDWLVGAAENRRST